MMSCQVKKQVSDIFQALCTYFGDFNFDVAEDEGEEQQD